MGVSFPIVCGCKGPGAWTRLCTELTLTLVSEWSRDQTPGHTLSPRGECVPGIISAHLFSSLSVFAQDVKHGNVSEKVRKSSLFELRVSWAVSPLCEWPGW